MRENIQENWPQTWEEIFKGIPTAPGTEAEQLRHKQLREEDEMTEAEEQELNILFYIIYPQLRPKDRKEMKSAKEFTMAQEQPSENPPTLEDIRTFARQLGVTLTEAQNSEWFDLDRTETPQLMGTYQTTQSGIDNAYGDLRRLELTQQAITKHDQHKQ